MKSSIRIVTSLLLLLLLLLLLTVSTVIGGGGDDTDTTTIEQQQQKCGKNAYYNNTIMECVCQLGYEGYPKSFCGDINECILNKNICTSIDINSKCFNMKGTYRCICNDMFIGSPETTSGCQPDPKYKQTLINLGLWTTDKYNESTMPSNDVNNDTTTTTTDVNNNNNNNYTYTSLEDGQANIVLAGPTIIYHSNILEQLPDKFDTYEINDTSSDDEEEEEEQQEQQDQQKPKRSSFSNKRTNTNERHDTKDEKIETTGNDDSNNKKARSDTISNNNNSEENENNDEEDENNDDSVDDDDAENYVSSSDTTNNSKEDEKHEKETVDDSKNITTLDVDSGVGNKETLDNDTTKDKVTSSDTSNSNDSDNDVCSNNPCSDYVHSYCVPVSSSKEEDDNIKYECICDDGFNGNPLHGYECLLTCNNPYGNPCGPESTCTDSINGIVCEKILIGVGCIAGCSPSMECQLVYDTILQQDDYTCVCRKGYHIVDPWFPCVKD